MWWAGTAGIINSCTFMGHGSAHATTTALDMRSRAIPRSNVDTTLRPRPFVSGPANGGDGWLDGNALGRSHEIVGPCANGSETARQNEEAPGRLSRRGRVVFRGTLGGSNDDHAEIHRREFRRNRDSRWNRNDDRSSGGSIWSLRRSSSGRANGSRIDSEQDTLRLSQNPH
jgi:hypothetical protein